MALAAIYPSGAFCTFVSSAPKGISPMPMALKSVLCVLQVGIQAPKGRQHVSVVKLQAMLILLEVPLVDIAI